MGRHVTETAQTSRLFVRLQHPFAAGEDADLSAPARVDLGAFLSALLPTGAVVRAAHETTLDGSQPVDALRRRRRMPTEGEDDEAVVADGAASAGSDLVVVGPMELRTFEIEVGRVGELVCHL